MTARGVDSEQTVNVPALALLALLNEHDAVAAVLDMGARSEVIPGELWEALMRAHAGCAGRAVARPER